MKTLRLSLLLVLLRATAIDVHGAAVADYAVQLSATVQTNPPIIFLSWPADPAATGYSIARKMRDDLAWGVTENLSPTATNYTDTNITVGQPIEYHIIKTASTYSGVGYIYTGVEVPIFESRGKVILLVDNTCVSNLSFELFRLERDLIGDGWTMLRHDVTRMAVDPANTNSSVWMARSNEIATVKQIITADYAADPANVKAVFILGHVPVPYSGNLSPDGHGNHRGAWPADVFYGDVDGVWNDSSVQSIVSSDLRNWNFRGDGKFDHTALPSDVELQVGRVDLANLPAFSLSEIELLRQYLNKDHNFRHKLFTVEPRGLIDDNFGENGGEPFAVNGWRNFAPMFGGTNVAETDWFTTLATQSYLWAYGCGPGNFTGASGVGDTSNFAASDPRVVFTMLFGSDFGDWDSPNSFLRAPLATPTYTLTCSWAGRPNWQFHHMALGETIGFSTRWAQNNFSTYWANANARNVHIALMGDPTLRMHVVAPPGALAATTNGSGGVNLSWGASPDAIVGYHVYRAPTAAGPFTRLNAQLLTTTNYTDGTLASNVYMVRAVKLELSASGSYYNPSQGIFKEFVPPPAITPADTTGALTSSLNPAPPGSNVTFTMTVSAVPPGAGPPTGTVQFQIDGANVGGPVPLNNGAASHTTSTLTHGTHTVVAAYGGDSNFTGTTNFLAQTINTPPVASPDTLERDPTNGVKVAITTLLNNDTDADGDVIIFLGVAATSAQSGTVVSNAGWIFYTPASGYTNTDTFTYTIGDSFSLSVTGLVTVNIRADNAPSANLRLVPTGNGSYEIWGDGIPGRVYHIQATEQLGTTNWQTLGTVTGDTSGLFLFLDATNSPLRFYRTMSP
jgi:hypothetical protein